MTDFTDKSWTDANLVLLELLNSFDGNALAYIERSGLMALKIWSSLPVDGSSLPKLVDVQIQRKLLLNEIDAPTLSRFGLSSYEKFDGVREAFVLSVVGGEFQMTIVSKTCGVTV
jgi:hypothetical protein